MGGGGSRGGGLACAEVRLERPLAGGPAGFFFAQLHTAAEGCRDYSTWGAPQRLALLPDDVVTASIFTAQSEAHFRRLDREQFAEAHVPWDAVSKGLAPGEERCFRLALRPKVPWIGDGAAPAEYRSAFARAKEDVVVPGMVSVRVAVRLLPGMGDPKSPVIGPSEPAGPLPTPERLAQGDGGEQDVESYGGSVASEHWAQESEASPPTFMGEPAKRAVSDLPGLSGLSDEKPGGSGATAQVAVNTNLERIAGHYRQLREREEEVAAAARRPPRDDPLPDSPAARFDDVQARLKQQMERLEDLEGECSQLETALGEGSPRLCKQEEREASVPAEESPAREASEEDLERSTEQLRHETLLLREELECMTEARNKAEEELRDLRDLMVQQEPAPVSLENTFERVKSETLNKELSRCQRMICIYNAKISSLQDEAEDIRRRAGATLDGGSTRASSSSSSSERRSSGASLHAKEMSREELERAMARWALRCSAASAP